MFGNNSPILVMMHLGRKKKWALKIYDLFSEIDEHMIQRIKFFSVSTIAKLSQDDIDHILVKFNYQETGRELGRNKNEYSFIIMYNIHYDTEFWTKKMGKCKE
ncbi:hypothetical protein RclHR1_38870001 [Rhizophagus clarus]|uniref:Uncharacterized protein n=1 Tax=Rhizophagus clarus TaxID=94130 RepID=A0A2Z6REG9_9GLOM|nr:hypothetical protein RclHR1_38870001 [Rhizophagus clarus]